ncbi:hypothetical protein PENSUB_9560 [Penicillium subrubescens]|uniref:Uncharacterized protein n=1 Tax=Penicillium subrubescens TaxID=1316194 RepID=A0A1Q5TCP9_9EURO|nr:hypothetical protein PENSUB_9560 [Penicillium subrubescens]
MSSGIITQLVEQARKSSYLLRDLARTPGWPNLKRGSSASDSDDELSSVLGEVEKYLVKSVDDGNPSTIFAYNGNISVGIYVGGGLEKVDAATTIIDALLDYCQ